ncbi:putative ROK-family transcriptional regulator [Streptomyces ambofaciens ATCC 23877]|uniref:Putative ROK-family transcriptional regulator n=1 Tax=Streptomyces ambofaciens (strain ATCC 23877 / 3486 / DSM 40053 / JCM 4204 / NBRC 12836 / NRRL B-2516) TaxID=278992 RepID=A0AC63_STRA7|nr:ROK family protein [Streptomyces ambofaciens]AKZ60287.1 putative ROK-family transcriptional regulator [Streptomyces ambofaciens ATCC 23877]CAJ88067.1 putative ROK-family transcriptional regulator [Streptomyces ambofaciens ATCC 23877]
MRVRSGRTVRDLRRENRTAVLQRLYFDGPLSRFSLGPVTGLSSGSVSNVVSELVAEGLVEEAGSVDSAGGRPRTLLRISARSGYMIGVDIGETRVRIELFDLALTELARVERPLEAKGPRRVDRYDVGLVMTHLREGIPEVLAEAGIAAERLLGVGIGVPGIVARGTEDGAVVHGQTIGWDAVPLERLLRESRILPETVPYYIDNGAKTLGQAEMWFGAGRGAQSAAVVLFGSGVGACVVGDDMRPGRAVEWGHLTVRVRGRRCRCGAQGCLEAYAGAEALLQRWAEAGGRPPVGADEETALTAMLAAAYPASDASGAGPEPDATALAVLEETAEYLGAGFSDLINLFQPERILVGGWAGLQLGRRFLDAVTAHATSYALTYPAARVRIDLGTLGPDAVTVGAAILPLADFFARGGRPEEAEPAEQDPAWRTALRERSVQ